ncbi:hypothetical protein SAY86_006400 [Trapa natans]|uniref:WRKY domain-containing protein n=1 Tax=Trapa natans TaxID=22666 RepID=A0AAN7L3I8_TRANT|nr:hypothetical protein SAY86_006400 [Trapa natans]
MSGDEENAPSFIESVAQNETEGSSLGPKSTEGNPDRTCSPSPDHSAELGSSPGLNLAPQRGLMERITVRAGFSALKLNTQGIRPIHVPNTEAPSPSHLLMLSPSSSPTVLLESPVFLSNSSVCKRIKVLGGGECGIFYDLECFLQVQPSPTTGRFSFVLDSSSRCLSLAPGPDRIRVKGPVEGIDSSSFAFKPDAELSSSFFSSEPKIDHHLQWWSLLVSFFWSKLIFRIRPVVKSISVPSHLQAGFSTSMMEKHVSSKNNVGTFPSDQRMLDNTAARANQSSPLDEEEDQKGDEDSTLQVKGGEYLRSYYKCTHPSCQVKKKVEQSHDGHITDIIYKGAHNHPMPPPSCRGIMEGFDTPEHIGMHVGIGTNQAWSYNGPQTSVTEWRQGNSELISSPSDEPGYSNLNNIGPENQNIANFEPGGAIEASSTVSNEEHQNDQANCSISLDPEAEEYVESKRRKMETYSSDMTGATRIIREPRVVVQTTSDVDILDDGYRWRKYWQKVVKGNPNPRSYYKCTSLGCSVRKHVERASHDLKSVITTYEGKHHHDVPAAQNSSHGNFGIASAQPVASGVQTNVHQPEPSQAHLGSLRFACPGALASFRLSGWPQLPHHTFGLNAQPGLPNLAMARMGGGNWNMPIPPIHPFLSAQQQNQTNQMAFILPKGELKPEHIAGAALNPSNNSSVYLQQLMNRLPLGPHEQGSSFISSFCSSSSNLSSWLID